MSKQNFNQNNFRACLGLYFDGLKSILIIKKFIWRKNYVFDNKIKSTFEGLKSQNALLAQKIFLP